MANINAFMCPLIVDENGNPMTREEYEERIRLVKEYQHQCQDMFGRPHSPYRTYIEEQLASKKWWFVDV